MATTKTKRSKASAGKKKSHRLKTGKSLEAVKPLTKVAAPTENISLDFSKIAIKYN